MTTNNIILIGFMGVGKGRLARELVRMTGFFAIDTDDMIESFEHRKIKKIFQNDGETYFRNSEQKVADWLEKNVQNTIVSTGGGFFAVTNLNSLGTVVYLQSDFDAIYEKMMAHPKAEKKIKKRPLFQNPAQARELLQSRHPLYAAKADLSIGVARKSSTEIAAELLNHVSC